MIVYKKDDNSTTLLLIINSYLVQLILHCYNEQTKNATLHIQYKLAWPMSI